MKTWSAWIPFANNLFAALAELKVFESVVDFLYTTQGNHIIVLYSYI